MHFKILPFLLLFGIVAVFSSCATLFTSRNQKIVFVTNPPARLVVDKDTLPREVSRHDFKVRRGDKPLNIRAFNDTLSKEVVVTPKSNFAFYSNVLMLYGLGMILDDYTGKRYSYPTTVNLNLLDERPIYSRFDTAQVEYAQLIKFSPLKLIDFVNSGLEIAYEKATSHRWSTQIMGSYLFPLNAQNTQYYPQNVQGFRTAVEQKYFIDGIAPVGTYVSFEVNYMNSKYTELAYFYDPEVLDSLTYNPVGTGVRDTFNIAKQTLSLHLKIGQQVIKNNWSFEFYAGIGARYKHVIHSNRQHPDYILEPPRHPNIFHLSKIEGKYWKPSIPLSFRIGYRF